MDIPYKVNKGLAFSTYREHDKRPSFPSRPIMEPLVEVRNLKALMQTPHGLRTVQDLYESLDGCINLHKAGKRLQQCLDNYLEAPSVETRHTLDRARATHDVELAKATKVAEYEPAAHETVTNGTGVQT